jgi:hypothetical protein
MFCPQLMFLDEQKIYFSINYICIQFLSQLPTFPSPVRAAKTPDIPHDDSHWERGRELDPFLYLAIGSDGGKTSPPAPTTTCNLS